MDQYLAKNLDNRKFKYWVIQFMKKAKFFNLNKIEDYETSIVGYIGRSTRVTFFKTSEWFYVTVGMKTFRRRNFLSFLRIFGNYINKKKDQLFEKLGDNLIKEIEKFLKLNFLKDYNVKNYSEDGLLHIIIHNLVKIKYKIKNGILSITINKNLSNKNELKKFILENFYNITRLKFLKKIILETKESRIIVRIPEMFKVFISRQMEAYL